MKSLRFLFAFLTLGFVLSSCQKDFSFEAGNAKGTLAKDASGDCVPSLVNGNFYKDTVLNATNYVDIQVDITKVGVYTITTDTINGYTFTGTGSTGVLGLNTVRLFGTGKPIIDGFDVFTVKFNGSSCEFSVAVNLGAGGGGGSTAIFTFPNAAACTGASQTNNFYVGLPTNPAINTMTLLVNVTQAGTYSLTTSSAGGLIFSGSGTLAVGNNQQIVLGASGTPAAPAGTITYTFSTTTPVASSCGFDLTVQAAPTPATFTFNCGTASFVGTYQVGTVMTAGNTITVPITVSTPGGYTLTTTVNGVTFAAAGVLTATTPSITLNASGTPAPGASPSTTFVLSGGGGPDCSVTIPFTTGGGGTDFLRAKINGGPLTNFNTALSGTLTNTGGVFSLDVTGDVDNTGVPTLGFSLNSDTPIAAGTYTETSLTKTAVGIYTNSTGTFAALPFGFGGTLTVVVTSVTTAPNRVIGTFSGTFKDANGLGTNNLTVTAGEFSVGY